MKRQTKETREHLLRQLVKLGDMMGDGQHLVRGGKWISKEYDKILRALGHKAARDSLVRQARAEAIDEAMAKRVAECPCPHCGGALVQTRKGSTWAVCEPCKIKFKLLKLVRKREKV